MATQTSTTAPDPRAAAYRAALDRPPTPRHVAALQALGLPVPATQGEASAALTGYYVALARCVEVGR